MKTWSQLFIRQGFQVKEIGTWVFNCEREIEINMLFLLESLDKLGSHYSYVDGLLEINQPAVSEQEWLEAVDYKWRGHGGYLWFRAGEEEPKIKKELDTYISGIIRQLNRLGAMINKLYDEAVRTVHKPLYKGINGPILNQLLTLAINLAGCHFASRLFMAEMIEDLRTLTEAKDRIRFMEMLESWQQKQEDFEETSKNRNRENLFKLK